MVKPREKDAVLVEFGKRVRKERNSRGWTQEHLAERVGVNRTYVGSIERGEKNVGLRIINKLALVLSDGAVGFVHCRIKRIPRRITRK